MSGKMISEASLETLTKAGFLAANERLGLARSILEREEYLHERQITSEQEYLKARQAEAEARISLQSSDQRLHRISVAAALLKVTRPSQSRP